MLHMNMAVNRFSSVGMIFCFGLYLVTTLQAQVSQLEAVHVFEIQIGGVVDSIRTEPSGGDSIYVMQGHRGEQRYIARVHGRHGRLLSVDEWAEVAAERIYEWPGIQVVAHRGGALLGPPENTLPAIEKAIEIGADLIEIDIRQTRDGHLVLMHDETVQRTTNGSGRVADLTLEQILVLEIKHDGKGIVRVPTLRDALQTMKGRIDPDLDYKEGDIEGLLNVVRELDMISDCTMHGSWGRCQTISDLEPRMRIRPTIDYPLQVPELARTLRPALINMDWHAVTEEAIRLTHTHGCGAFVNCLERADTALYMELAVEAGADYIQSDRPDLVVEYLKERNLYRLSEKNRSLPATPLQSRQLTYPFR
ncbi:MAG: glycerophosphodiester phosphodiesterase [Verrucomicrobiota bacterium]|jgi:glycerophosphoryl diester phosphodiesterase